MFKKYWQIYLSIVLCLTGWFVAVKTNIIVLIGIMFYLTFVLLILINNKDSVLRNHIIDSISKKDSFFILIFAIALILLCILPMDISPFWNGKIPMHRNQYELLADSIMNGHLYIEYDDIDPKLLAMDNPYDYEARLANEVIYHWDHAFYNGHYYMYFGVAPVFVLFIPFKLIFGKTLVTFHATQFFVMFSIVAFFILFYLISKSFFKKMSIGTFVLSTAAVCMICLGYCVQAPALYCTAISGGIFFMLWSLIFYFYAVYYAKKEWTGIIFAFIGALCGALAFGCRPPVALANLIAIPLAVTYAKNYTGKRLMRNFIIIVLPYLVVAGLLMTYNYLRFENPFEFGQSYQLTSGDQTIYMSFFDRFNILEILSGVLNNLLSPIIIDSKQFPHFFYGGLLATYPLMWLIVVYYSKNSVHTSLKNDKMGLLVFVLLLEPVFVSAMDSYWSPGLCERYRLDEYFVYGILIFILLGYRIKTTLNYNRTNRIISLFSVASILLAVIMFFYPCDANYTEIYPEKLDIIKSVLSLGLK